MLIRPFAALELVKPGAKILVIGPRSEDDILHLMGYGFTSVRGVDLITYSPYVDLGDMHALPYPDDSFDAVLLGWVIPYSQNHAKVVEEVARVRATGRSSASAPSTARITRPRTTASG